MFQILIVEDEEPISNLIKMSLTKSGYHCQQVFDGYEAANYMEKKRYDLILLDIMLPGIDGYELLEYSKLNEMPVIFITAMGDLNDRVKGLRAGADDYITKPFSLMVLVSKVQAFMRRMEGVCGHNRILSGNIEVNYGEMRALKRNADGVTPLTLSKKELQIMIYFMENARQILSKEQILEYVWDVDGQFVDDNTVPVNISRLKGKIGNDYIQNVRGMGYIWTEESVQE